MFGLSNKQIIMSNFYVKLSNKHIWVMVTHLKRETHQRDFPRDGPRDVWDNVVWNVGQRVRRGPTIQTTLSKTRDVAREIVLVCSTPMQPTSFRRKHI